MRTTISSCILQRWRKNSESLLKRQAVINADRTIISIKTHMGTDYKVNIDGKIIVHKKYQL
ncbi:hypothetical protein Q5M85_08095 [Paraclostridium bifermentans]|nr:hypothetical protein [Paraclostridium bifermentans]